MYSSTLDGLLRQVGTVRAHVRTSERIRNLIMRRDILCTNAARACFDVGSFYSEALDPTEWRIIDHCAAVTRLYAVYERFVADILGAHLAFLESNFKYAELNDRLRRDHRRFLGNILADLDKSRYGHLPLESVIKDFQDCLSGSASYRILPDALLTHDQNLRMPELSELFSRCDVGDMADWMSRHRTARAFFREQSRQSDTVDAELRQIVEARNDAAHGGLEVDNVYGSEVLVEFADFIAMVCIVIHERICHEGVSKLVTLRKADEIGTIRHKYSNNRVRAIIGAVTISVGDAVYIKQERCCYRAAITSLMEDDKLVSSITAYKDREIGISFDVEPFLHGDIVYVPV